MKQRQPLPGITSFKKEDSAAGQTVNILICLGIIVVNLVIYFQVYSYDVASINEIVAINIYHEGFTVQNLKRAFGGPSIDTAYYGPVALIFSMIDVELFGSSPGPRHLVNLFFHIGCSLLLFLLLFKTTRQSWPSGLVAILFASHPLNVESVAWIAMHDSSLSAFFMMLGLLAYLSYVKKPDGRLYLLMTLFLALGLMSKSTIVYFPFILLLLDYWPLNRLSLAGGLFQGGRKNPIIEKVPLIIFVCLWVVETWFFYYYADFSRFESAPKIGLAALSSLPEAFVSYINYLGKIFYPTGLAPALLLPRYHYSLWQAAISAMLLIVITGLAFFCARHGRRYVLMGWLWFMAVMAPGVAVNATKHTLITDRYAYIGAIGIFIIVAWGADELFSRLRPKKTIPVIAGTLAVLVLMGLSLAQTRHWRNTITLLNHAINLAPENGDAYRLLGNVLSAAGQKAEALNAYNKALALSPDSAAIYNIIGVIRGELGDRPGAMESFEKALELKPGYATAYHNLGNLLLDSGKTDKAIACFEAALKTDPLLFQTHNSLAAALTGKGQIDKAVRHLRQALKINPRYETARENLDKISLIRETDS